MSAPTALGRRVSIETPEHVAIGYELADLGSRFLALFLDLLLLFLALAILGFGAGFALATADVAPEVASWGAAILILAMFVATFGYFLLFEGLGGGRTPGKRLAGIRVIHDGGYPLTFRGSAVRNLIRLVDLQPAFTWVVGGAAMMLSPRTRRLGDLAAGTIVVRDRVKGTLPERELLARAAVEPPVLEHRQFEVLSSYVARRLALSADARARIAATLATSLADHLDDDVPLPADKPSGGWKGGSDVRNDARLVALHAAEAPRWQHRGEGPVARSAQAVALVRTQTERWNSYRALAARARRGLRALPEDDLTRFAGMYREVAADLARARTYHGSIELQETLERMVGAGHNLLYRPIGRSMKALRAWVSWGFPRLVRKRAPLVALSALLLFGPMYAAYSQVRADPEWARQVLPVEMVIRAEQAGDRLAQGRGYIDMPEPMMPIFSTALIANNVQVTFWAFAGGIIAGLGTALILVMNGVSIGAVIGLYTNHEAASLLWAFVASHGVLELTAIVISGAAGMWLGSAIYAPGRRTRLEALRRRGRDAVGLLGGTTVLLILAGFVEGFVSPSVTPNAVKFAFAGVVALALLAYLSLAGRSDATADPAA